MQKISERTVLLSVLWFVLAIQILVIFDIFVFSDSKTIKVTTKTFEDGGGVYLDKDKYYISTSGKIYRTSSDIWERININTEVDIYRSSFADYIYKIQTPDQQLWFRNMYIYLSISVLFLGLLIFTLLGSEIALYIGMLPAIYLLNAFRMLF